MNNIKGTLFALQAGPSIRPSFGETLKAVKEAIEAECFTKEELGQINELCMMIAEMFMLNPQDEVRINGGTMPISLVQEVYRQIGHEHVAYVAQNFQKLPYEVKNKKAYLRTALYNSVFEQESHWINQYHASAHT